MTKNDLMNAITCRAEGLGFRVYTSMDDGFPDCFIVGGSRLLIVKLMDETEEELPAVSLPAWWATKLRETGIHVYCWRPSHWDQGRVEAVLCNKEESVAGENGSEPGDDSYAGLLAMVREAHAKRERADAAFEEAQRCAIQFLRDAEVEVHEDDLVKVLDSLGVGNGSFAGRDVVTCLMVTPIRRAEGGRVTKYRRMLQFERGRFERSRGIDGQSRVEWVPELKP